MKKISAVTHFTTGAIEEITMQDDSSNFRWTRKHFGLPTGLNYLSEKKETVNGLVLTYEFFNGLVLTVDRQFSDFEIEEKYTLSNPTEKEIEVDENCTIEIAFADETDICEVALKRRAYSRVFSGGNSFAVYNGKFNGDEDGVGVVLTEGVLGKVSKKENNVKSLSFYDVGFFSKSLAPNEETSFKWVIFAFENVNEFIQKVLQYQPFPLFEPTPILKGQKTIIITTDQLFIDEKKEDERDFVFEKPSTIKVSRENRKIYEFTFIPKSEEDYARELFVKSLYQRERDIDLIFEARESNGNKAKEILLKYFKKKKKDYFDVGIPVDIIEKDDELKTLFLKKAEYALSAEKGFYYPYQTLAKYDYLKKAYSINPDLRYLDKLDELEKLRLAIYRLWR